MVDLFIGIDIGGTYVKGIAYVFPNNEFSKLKKLKFERLGNSEKEFNINIISLIDELIKIYPKCKLRGIGIASAAIFDRMSGKIIAWPNNNCWKGMELKKLLSDKYKTLVKIEDDANTAAVYQKNYGLGKNYENFIYITVSTGIGCGIYLNNKLYLGKNGFSGEIGHIKVSNKNIKCVCGKKGCVQAISSGRAINKDYNDASEKFIENNQIIINLAEDGDALALKVINNAAKHIAKLIEAIIMFLDLECIILGGGSIDSNNIYYSYICKHVNKSLLRDRNIKILKCTDSDKFGAIGAISLVYEEYNKRRKF